MTKQEIANMHVLHEVSSGGFAPGSFFHHVIQAPLRADAKHFSRLAIAFPEHAEAVLAWRKGELKHEELD